MKELEVLKNVPASTTPSPMPLSGRKRASFALLLILAAGLVVAGAAAAASMQEMRCCPAGAEVEAHCTWLGASECCPERPGAAAPAHGTPAAPPAHGLLTPQAILFAPAARAPGALALPLPARTLVLRL
jgi:hypothetical protein